MPANTRLFRSTFVVMLLFAFNKVVGFVRIQLVANVFGTGADFDAFTSANQLPELFFALISGGALAAALIPVYSQHLTNRGTQEAARLANTILTLLLLILGVICLIGALVAPWLTRVVLVPDFSAESQQLTAQLMRIILVSTTIFGVSGVFSSLLNAHQHFALPALAQTALDAGYFVGLFLLVPRYGIHGLAWGTVIAASFHLLIQLPALWQHRIGWRPAFDINMSGVREIGRLMGPRMVTLGTIQAADLVIIRLGSQFGDGTLSGYFYGYTLMQLPETLFGTTVGVVLFPTMAELFNRGDIERLKLLAVRGLNLIWSLTIPSMFGLILLGRPAIAFVFEGGAFGADSTALVYGVLLYFAARIVAEGSLEIVARLFYARHNTRTPMFAYLGWFAVSVVLTYLLTPILGIGGAALASTVAFTFLSSVLYWLNRRELGDLGERELVVGFGRNLLASVGMAGVILLIRQLPLTTVPYLFVAASVGGVVYLLLYHLLGGRDLHGFVAMLTGRDSGWLPTQE